MNENQTVNGEDILSGETATHLRGTIMLPNYTYLVGNYAELRKENSLRIQIGADIWDGLLYRHRNEKKPKIGILYDDDGVNGVIPMYLQGWSRGDSITPSMAIFGRVLNGAAMDPRTFYTLFKSGYPRD